MIEINDLHIKGQVPSSIISSPQQFAQSIGVSEHVVRNWIKEGILPVVRIGRRVFINVVLFTEILRESEINTPIKNALQNKKNE